MKELTETRDYLEINTPYLVQKSRDTRARVLYLSNHAKSAHAGSALSCIEILVSLFHRRVNLKDALDKIILSKGHAAMALYATAEQFNLIDSDELDRYLTDGSALWGHPSMSSGFDWIDWSTGSLGHGLPAAVGFAYNRKILNPDLASSHSRHAVSVILSDGECNEGSNWEAILFAGHHHLSNLSVFIDYNKIQSLDHVDNVIRLEPFRQKFIDFGWDCLEIDGHSIDDLLKVWQDAEQIRTKPMCVICHTIKGKGVPDIEGTVLSHYRPVSEQQIEAFLNAK
jgi:transketolase